MPLLPDRQPIGSHEVVVLLKVNLYVTGTDSQDGGMLICQGRQFILGVFIGTSKRRNF